MAAALRAAAVTKLFMTVLLELNAVSKFYGALKAVDTVSLAVQTGEALAVIGPNGAGKSTMFNLITGDVAPSKGRVLFDGSDMTAMAPHARSRLGIGRSYQIPHPFANMSVFENLLVGAIFGGGASERQSYQRCNEVLRVTGLYDKANMPARTLTLLQRKRLELARALAMQPKLLLLDEIAGGLTERECGELIKTIKEIHACGTTIVWIEHIVHALVSVASRLIVMNFGQILAEGDPQRVMADARVREVYMGMPVS
jgi:branched-chain amino acid transport system ATP-binding protein